MSAIAIGVWLTVASLWMISPVFYAKHARRKRAERRAERQEYITLHGSVKTGCKSWAPDTRPAE